MKKGRLEAFSDGVLAIIITIMVLEIKVPEGSQISDLKPLFPIFVSYLLSFIYLAIYWNNHHHMMQTVSKISGDILWANMHLLFWLSLIPFTTGWVGENNFNPIPMALYGFVLLMAAVAYFILQYRIIYIQGPNSILAKAVGKDKKGKSSLVLYALAITLCWINHWVSGIIYIFVALIWLIPDRRIEQVLNQSD